MALHNPSFVESRDEGVLVAIRTAMNFIGAGVTVTDDPTNGEVEVAITSGGGGISNVVEDTTPQLGGDLDANTHQVTGLVAPDANGEAIRATTKITEANLEDAVDKKHSANADTDLDATFEATFLKNALLTERGSIIFRNATVPAELLHGTVGNLLQSGGDAADPSWVDHNGASDPHTGYRLESADHSHATTGAQAGQIDHGAAAVAASLLDDDHTQYLLASGGRALAGNLDFAKYKAIAMTCDNGATAPASPTTGQWFLHTPTGRTILVMYDGTNWIPIISLGTMTVYVDNTDGTDALDKGGAVDAGAVKTVQYAVNLIPGLVGGNVVININAESYAENVVVQGKNFTGNYTITLQGVLTAGDALVASGNGVKGATTALPSWTDTGLTAGAYNNLLFYFTSGANNGLYRVVDINTTTTMTMSGPTLAAQPVLNDTGTIYSWGTVVTTITGQPGQQNLYIADLSTSQIVSIGANLHCTNVKSTGSSVQPFLCLNQGSLWLGNCVSTGTFFLGSWAMQYSLLTINGGKFVGWTTWGLYSDSTSLISVGGEGGVIIDGGAASGSNICVYVTADSVGKFFTLDVYNVIRNATNGLKADIGSICYQTGTNSYSGNTTNENAVAASYGYID